MNTIARIIAASFLTLLFALPALANPVGVKQVNAMRASKGAAPLTYSTKLEQAARAHVNDMQAKGFFSHKGSNGSSVSDRVSKTGYKWCFVAENIAKGQKTLDAVLKAWRGSPPHYKNIINKKARDFAVVEGKGKGKVWVMVLAGPC